MANTTSQLQAKIKALTDGKVDIMVDADNFKNTTEILREMSKVWEDMTDKEQAAALELLGGKRQANTLSAIIQNFDIVEDAIKTSENSAGSALKENEKVLDSIQGKLNLFNNAVETFWNNLLDSDVIKFFVDLGTQIVQLASDFGEVRSVIFAILMYFNMSKKYPFDLASMIFGKNGLVGFLSGLKKVKTELAGISKSQSLFGLPEPKTPLRLTSPQTGLVPTGPTDLTPNSGSPTSIATTPIIPEKEKTNFFADMIKNARMAASSIWQLFMNMLNKLKAAASGIFINAFNSAKSKLSNFTNQIKRSYYKATNQAFMTDENGKVHKASVIDTRMSIYENNGDTNEKEASKFSTIWDNHIIRLKDSINRVKQDFTAIWKHHNERMSESVKYASMQFNKLKISATNTFGKISTVASNVANEMKNAYSKATDFMKSKISSIRGSFVGATSKSTVSDETRRVDVLQDTSQDAYKSARQDTRQAYGEINSTAGRVAAEVSRIWKQHIVNLRGSFAAVKNDISTIWQHHKARVADSTAHAKSQFAKMTNNISAQFNTIKGITSNVFNKISVVAKTASVAIKNFFGDKIVNPIVSKFNNMANKIKVAFNKIKMSASTVANATAATFKNKFGYGSSDNNTPSWLSVGSSLTIDDLKIPTNAAEEIDKIKLAAQESEVALNRQMLSYGSSNKALQAYIASLNGATPSMAGFKAFCDAQNMSLQATGPAALIAKIGIIGLQAALSMGVALLMQFVMSGLIKLVQYLKDVIHPAEKLKEELSNLGSEISDIQSEIDSLNTELETTKNRMSELLAMDSLSFTEKEELEQLKQKNAELERQLRLLESLEESKQGEATETAKDTINKGWHSTGFDKSYYIDAKGVIHEDAGWGGFWNSGTDTKSALDTAISRYQTRSNDLNKLEDLRSESSGEYVTEDLVKKYGLSTVYIGWSAKNIEKEIEKIKEEKDNMAKGIDMVLADQLEIIKNGNLSYELNDPEVTTYLNEVYGYTDKWNMVKGTTTKSNIITDMFADDATDAMKQLENRIQEVSNNESLSLEEQNQQIQNIINSVDKENASYERLKVAMETVGLTAKDIADYYTLESGAYDNSSEGIIKQYETAITVMKQLQNGESLLYTDDSGTQTISYEMLFEVDKDGKAVAKSEEISKIMQGTSEEVRKQFSSLIEDVKNGNIEWSEAIQKMNLYSSRAVIESVKTELESLNTEVFKGIKDDIEGIIDTFDELTKAVGNTVDALDVLKQAQKEEEYSGSVSLETLEKLMTSTDNYADIIEVDETGAIRLATNAQQILVEQKIEAIKTNAELALADAETAYQEALHAEQSITVSSPAQEGLRKVIMSVSGALAYVSSMYKDLTSGNLDGIVGRAKDAYNNAVSSKQSQFDNQAANAAASVVEAKERLDSAEKMNKIAQGLTADNIETRYSADKASGEDKDNSDDAFKKAMDYWENRLSANQARYDQLQNEIDLIEKKGGIAGKEYYEEQIKLENERLRLLEAQKAEAQKFLGTFKEGSDEWWEVASTLNDIESDIDSVTSSIQDLNDAIDQIHWDVFDESHERFSDLIGQLETVRDLLSADEDQFFDDEGQWTEKGVAALGTYIQEIEIYKNALKNVNDELANLKIEDFDSEQEYYDKLTELTEKQRDYSKSISDSEQAVVGMYESQIDAIEEWTSKAVDAYKDYIDVVKESLDAERD